MRKILFLILLVSFIFSCSKKKRITAEVVVKGKIWTSNPQMPWAEMMAIQSDTILAIGSVKEVEAFIGDSTKVQEFKDQLVLPGFIDSHTHFLLGGHYLSSVQLRNVRTKEEFIARIKDFAQKLPKGAWIQGGGWDNQNWGGELPTRDWIDSVTAENPVWVIRTDDHMALANTAALNAPHVHEQVKQIAGGTIVKDAKGRVTGIFKDNNMTLIKRAIPRAPEELKIMELNAAMEYANANGVTSVHNVVDAPDVIPGHEMWRDIEILEKVRDHHQLKVRIYVASELSQWKELKAKIDKTGRGDKWLRIDGLKGFMDGSLGSHTAAFKQPFSDAPKDSGFFITPTGKIKEWATAADKERLHVMIHAIGDKAIHNLLNTFEAIEKENGPGDRRFRIEHAQHIDPSDMARFSQLKVIASMQPYHCIDDGRWAEKFIGPERIKTTYAFKSLLNNHARVAFGSDWPIAPATPLEGIYAAVTRRTLDNKNPGGWVPEQKITVEEAVKAYTLNAAYASFDEKIKGSLEKGKLADYVVLDNDIFKIAPEHIRDVGVVMTVVGGVVVYERK